MKECEKIQFLLLDSPEAPAVQSHLAHCVECAEFADFTSRIFAVKTNELVSPTFNSIMRRQERRRHLKFTWIPIGIAAAFVCSLAVIQLKNYKNIELLHYDSNKITTWSVNTDVNAQRQEIEIEFSWDSFDINGIQNEFEQMSIACNWDIQSFNSITNEVSK